jgi:hypothetical protein
MFGDVWSWAGTHPTSERNLGVTHHVAALALGVAPFTRGASTLRGPDESRATYLAGLEWFQSWLRLQSPRDFRTRQSSGRRAMTAVQMSRRHESRASSS